MQSSYLQKFIDAYREQYKQETETLIKSLTSDSKKVALVNSFLSKTEQNRVIENKTPWPLFDNTYFFDNDFKPIVINGLLSHYFIDQASLIAPLIMPLKPNTHILDMCAAPGGKLLALMSRKVPNITYTLNDISRARLHRLKKVLGNYLPKNFRDSFINLSNKDANWFGIFKKNTFDAVLLDAPCSSEAHVIKSSKLIKSFKGLRKGLAKRQYSLLCAALLCVKAGGYIVYCTCSINKHENEGVIKRLMDKKGDVVEIKKINIPFGKMIQFGTMILPHKHQCGPMFISLIRKIRSI